MIACPEYVIEKYGKDHHKVGPQAPAWVDNLYCMSVFR